MERMDKWLSIIVPVYNAEKYLPELMDSLLNQDVDKKMYEIILFDDSSTDGSLTMAQQYASTNENVRVFTHPNVGVAKTRNAGLDKAVGEYVWFLDNDDWIAKDVLSVLYRETERNKVDFLLFDSVNVYDGKYRKLDAFTVKETPVQSGKKTFVDFYYSPVPWNKLLRRKFLKEYNLYFAQKYSEDGEWGSRCFYHAAKVKAIAVDVVYYRILSDSFSHDKRNLRITLEGGLLPCLEHHYEYMLSHPDNQFWICALVLDVRRIHIGLDIITDLTLEERKRYLKKERDICRNIVAHLPLSAQLDYWILLACSVSPSVIVWIQRTLRNLKRKLKN